MHHDDIVTNLAQINTKLDRILPLVEKHEEKLQKHKLMHVFQLGATVSGHGLEHAKGIFNAILAFLHF